MASSIFWKVNFGGTARQRVPFLLVAFKRKFGAAEQLYRYGSCYNCCMRRKIASQTWGQVETAFGAV
ncbi:MAG: hypothetical protein DME32_13170 [Verrucomicrobia bacterium]|nr:MAG: hypothetical protein DME32_13170 [Verrucomicrobiota bacterium]